MSFTSELWDSIVPIYSKILSHPFLTELKTGALPLDAFKYYILQDAIYLRSFSKGLSILAAKAENITHFQILSQHINNTIVVEQSLHGLFFKDWGITAADIDLAVPAPNNLMYTAYLLSVAYEKVFAEAISAFLPCYWIYAEVGNTLIQSGSPVTIYQKWISTYSSEAFQTALNEMLLITNDVANQATASTHQAMKMHFIRCSQMEYLFWDMAYRKQTFDALIQ
jgi:thiaminase/transcriptional activator TenA